MGPRVRIGTAIRFVTELSWNAQHITLVRSFTRLHPKATTSSPPKGKGRSRSGPLPSFQRFDRVSSAVRLTNRHFRSYHGNREEINGDIVMLAARHPRCNAG